MKLGTFLAKIYWWYWGKRSFRRFLQVKEPKLKCCCGKRTHWYGYRKRTDAGYTLYLYKCPSCANVYSIELIGKGIPTGAGKKREKMFHKEVRKEGLMK